MNSVAAQVMADLMRHDAGLDPVGAAGPPVELGTVVNHVASAFADRSKGADLGLERALQHLEVGQDADGLRDPANGMDCLRCRVDKGRHIVEGRNPFNVANPAVEARGPLRMGWPTLA